MKQGLERQLLYFILFVNHVHYQNTLNSDKWNRIYWKEWESVLMSKECITEFDLESAQFPKSLVYAMLIVQTKFWINTFNLYF